MKKALEFLKVCIPCFMVLSAVCIANTSLAQQREKTDPATQMPVTANATSPKPFKGDLSYRIIPGQTGTWGYDILSNGKMLIHQPVRPGAVGNKGFASREIAAKAAELAINKMKAGAMPPTITEEELTKLEQK